MTGILLHVLLTAVCTSLFLGTGSHAIRIVISPEKSIAMLDNDIHITCSSDGDDVDKEILMMEITRNNQPPIVFLRDCLNISYGPDMSRKFKGEGRIDKHGGQSFLNLTLLRPRSEDTGIYTCVVYHVNEAGILQEESRSKTLTVEKIDVSSLETVLNGIKEKIKTNERNTEKEINDLKVKDQILTNERNASKEVKDLRDQMMSIERNIRKDINEMKEKIGYVTAFTVSNKHSAITSHSGTVLILPDVIVRRGEGYDETTGVFTAPTDGLYAFHVVIFQVGCYFDLDLMANDKLLAKLRSHDADWDQSSISSVADLKTGDKVFSIMRDTGCTIHASQYSVFTGYLIKSNL